MERELSITNIPKEPRQEIMTFEEYENRHHETPYVYELEDGEKKLTYFGAEHSRDPENPQFKRLEQEFRKIQPQLIFVEGIEDMEGFIKKELENIKESEIAAVIGKYGEKGLAIKLAIKAGVEFQSPEPNEEEQVANLLEQGFSQEDIFAHYVYFNAEQYQYHGGEPSEEILESIIKKFKADFDWTDFDFSLGHLKQIWQRLWPDRADPLDFNFSRLDPVKREANLGTWTVVNEINSQRNIFRDQFMMEKIKQALENVNRLFIVYGASHAYMQEPALRKLFETDFS